MSNTWTVFVYGTLRKGGALEGLLPDIESRRVAVLDGFTMFEYGHGAYPIIVETPGSVVPIVGDLLVTSDAESLAAVAEMECRAGYEMRWLDVRTIDDHEMHRAIVFVWPECDSDFIGRHVQSGDWATHEQMLTAPLVVGAGSVVVFGDES